MAGWNKSGNAFVTASRQGEIRLYELPNAMRSDYMKGVAMTSDTTEAIAEALSNRAIEEGRIVPFTANSTNAPPGLASLPDIHQFADQKLERAWHLHPNLPPFLQSINTAGKPWIGIGIWRRPETL